MCHSHGLTDCLQVYVPKGQERHMQAVTEARADDTKLFTV